MPHARNSSTFNGGNSEKVTLQLSHDFVIGSIQHQICYQFVFGVRDGFFNSLYNFRSFGTVIGFGKDRFGIFGMSFLRHRWVYRPKTF